MEIETEMAITSLESEKRMNAMAVKGYQSEIANRLNGSMGDDMKDVLSGKKEIRLSKSMKIKYKIKLWLARLGLGQRTLANLD